MILSQVLYEEKIEFFSSLFFIEHLSVLFLLFPTSPFNKLNRVLIHSFRENLAEILL